MASAEMPFPAPPAPEVRDLFIQRLSRLLRLRRDFDGDLNGLGVEMIHRSIYATYRDCLDFGAAEEAQRLMVAAGLKPDGQENRTS